MWRARVILIPEFRGWPRFRRACSRLLVSPSRRPVSPSESFLHAQADDCLSVSPSLPAARSPSAFFLLVFSTFAFFPF